MKLKHTLFALLGLVGTACSNQELEEGSVGTEQVQVTAGITKSRVSFSEADNITNAYWQNGDAITLNTPTQGNLNYTATVSEEDTTTATFAPESGSLKDIDGETVYACYPATTITDGVVALPATNTWTDEKPLPFAYAVSNISDSKVNLSFDHTFAFLKLTLSAQALESATSTDGDKTVHRLSVKSASGSLGVVSGTFNFEDKNVSITEGSDEVVFTLSETFNPSEETERTVYIPVLPQPAETNITITLIGNDGQTLYTLTKQTPTSGLLAGYIYYLQVETADVAYLVDGPTFNARIKELVSGGSTDDYLIGKIQFLTDSINLPANYITVSAEGPQVPIYAYFNQADSLLTISTTAKRMEIKNASCMFQNLKSLHTIDFGNFNINETTTSISGMFLGCSSLTTLDVSNWDTSNVTDMSEMFEECIHLTELDVTNWKTDKVKNMSKMFYDCYYLNSLDVSNWRTDNVTSMSSMFYRCANLSTLNVANWNTEKLSYIQGMFNMCSSLVTLNVATWNVSNIKAMNRMFANCSSLTTLDVSNWDTSNVTDMSEMFKSCSSLIALELASWQTNSVENMDFMFSECTSLKALDLANWNTSLVTNMEWMFKDCFSLAILDIANWETSNVKDMSYMFYGCSSLTTLYLAKWETSNVKDMSYMFKGCSSLNALSASNWQVSHVTDMAFMFSACSSLTTLNIANWDISNVTNMDRMFLECASASKACKIYSTKDVKEFLLSQKETTYMHPEWFTWE